MEIYHGGYCSIEKPEIIGSRYSKDFGTGFYCTQMKEQAMRWARRYDTPVVSIYNYKENDQLKILTVVYTTKARATYMNHTSKAIRCNYSSIS